MKTLRFVLLCALISCLLSCLNPCDNTFISEHLSPSKTRKIIVFERSCGATTDFSTQASLLRAGATIPGGAGNLFIADTDHGKAPSGRMGGPDISIKWLSEQSIEVLYYPQTRFFLQKQHLDGVAIMYAPIEQQEGT